MIKMIVVAWFDNGDNDTLTGDGCEFSGVDGGDDDGCAFVDNGDHDWSRWWLWTHRVDRVISRWMLDALGLKVGLVLSRVRSLDSCIKNAAPRTSLFLSLKQSIFSSNLWMPWSNNVVHFYFLHLDEESRQTKRKNCLSLNGEEEKKNGWIIFLNICSSCFKPLRHGTGLHA